MLACAAKHIERILRRHAVIAPTCRTWIRHTRLPRVVGLLEVQSCPVSVDFVMLDF